MALKLAKISYELREVLLKDKPEEMLALSPKGTVPVLQLNDKILDESLDIINWAFAKNPSNFYTAKGDESKLTSQVIKLFDNDFKYHLDRFKYSTRYKDINEEFHFTNAIKFIKRWNELLAENKYFFGDSPTIADWSIWPFVRQFRIACESQKRTNYFEPSIKNWLDSFENNEKFQTLMYKYELWEPNSRKNYFPSN